MDSEADAATMENHRTPPRVACRPSRRTSGTDIRSSATVGVRFLYVAGADPGGALRVAVPLSEIDAQVIESARQACSAQYRPGVSSRHPDRRAAGARPSRRFASDHVACRRAGARQLPRPLLEPAPANSASSRAPLTRPPGICSTRWSSSQREHAELEKLERVRKDFVINVSHELRTPLASIQGYTETLIDGALNDPAHNMRFLGIIRHNAERLARLTDDLLTLSRVEQKRQKFEFEFHPSTPCSTTPSK